MFSNSYVAMLALGGPPAGSPPEEQKKAMFMQMGMMVFFGVIFYVMLIRPQQKRAKEQAKMLRALSRTDGTSVELGLGSNIPNAEMSVRMTCIGCASFGICSIIARMGAGML